MNTRRQWILRVLVSAGLLGGLVWAIGPDAITGIRVRQWGWLPAVVVLANLDRLLMAYKWSLLLAALGLRPGFRSILASYYSGTLWGALLPMSVGADLVRGVHLHGAGASGRSIAASIIMERLLGVVASLIVGLISVILAVTLVGAGLIALGVLLALGCTAMLLVIAGLLTSRRFAWAVVVTLRRVRRGWAMRLTSAHRALRRYRHSRGTLARFTGLSVLEQWLPAVCDWCVARALGFDVPLWSFVVFVPLILAAARIPLTVGGLGLREGLYVYLFGYASVAPAAALAVGLSAYVLSLLALLPVQFVLTWLPTSKPTPGR